MSPMELACETEQDAHDDADGARCLQLDSWAHGHARLGRHVSFNARGPIQQRRPEFRHFRLSLHYKHMNNIRSLRCIAGCDVWVGGGACA